jgi:hypothetical protein
MTAVRDFCFSPFPTLLPLENDKCLAHAHLLSPPRLLPPASLRGPVRSFPRWFSPALAALAFPRVLLLSGAAALC